MRTALTLMIALAALFSFALGGCKRGDDVGPGYTDDEVILGLFVSTSGDFATFGQDTQKGVELAVEQINADGGINGKKIKLRVEDTRSLPEEGGNAASKLASGDSVFMGLGAVASSVSLNAAPVFKEKGIPMISPSSTNPTVTEQGDNIFRICYLDDFQGAACAVFAHKDMKARKAAILSNQDDAYSTGLARFFKAKFQALGGEIVADESFKKGTSDFTTQVTNIKGKGADVIFAPVYYNDAALIGKAFRSQGVDTPLLGGDGWESSLLTRNAEGSLEGCYFGNHYSQQDESEKVQKFVSSFTEKYGQAPSSLAALGYDVVFVAKAAIEQAGEFDRAKVVAALKGLKDFEGVTGKFSMVGSGDAEKPISMLKIVGDKFDFVRKIQPEEVK
jgi:branched-chain amino acid transport system substrate-binding protein